MRTTAKTVSRLQSIFDEAWRRIVAGRAGFDEQWTSYLNSLDCLIIEHEDLLGNFDDMVNFGVSVKESVCVKNPYGDSSFILVPVSLAEKALVLGSLAGNL